MLRSLAMTLVLALATMGAGCHHIKSDYPTYLQKHSASPALPRVPLEARYSIGEATLHHRLSIRSALAGYGNKWIVEFGAMLEQTMQSTELQETFAGLTRQAASSGKPGYGIAFDLVDYQVSGLAAHLALRVVLERDGVVLIDKIYRSDGVPQVGKVFWGGAFTMRNALQASTKHAIDAALREFLIDTQRATAAGGGPVVASTR